MDGQKRLPVRKRLRLENYDYATNGVYFITVCTLERRPVLWKHRRGDHWSPADDLKPWLENETAGGQWPPLQVPLSSVGVTVKACIDEIEVRYPQVYVDKSCVMPDHIHLLLRVEQAQQRSVSQIINQFKGAVTKRVGQPIWQKSFIDKIIRNKAAYQEVWKYIDQNPLKYAIGKEI